MESQIDRPLRDHAPKERRRGGGSSSGVEYYAPLRAIEADVRNADDMLCWIVAGP